MTCCATVGRWTSRRWPGPAGPCRLHSLVFHPRLVGGSPESVFYQDYLLPLTARPEQQNLVLRAEALGCGPVAAAIEALAAGEWPFGE